VVGTIKVIIFITMSITAKSVGYTQIALSQVGDYVAIRTNDYKTSPFSCIFSGQSVFDGAEVGLYKNFTKLDGSIGDCETPMVSGSGEQFVYTQPQSVPLSGIMPSDWYIFRVLSIGTSTNIIFAINGIDFQTDNIITNVLTIDNV
jgi:hypothetical protein